MSNEWQPPEGHPLTIERAKALMAGNLDHVYRSILKASCAPIFWSRVDDANTSILHNGTLTVVRTPKRLLGITAAHVWLQYEEDHAASPVRLQVMNAQLDAPRVIAISKRLDLATIQLSEHMLEQMGKDIVPLPTWPPRVPQEGRGIMLAGYPGVDRLQPKSLEVSWGLFTALGIARRVIGPQITWVVERDQGSGDLPPNHHLGGISGGPLIGWFESANHLTQYVLCGIIAEAHQQLENVVARRADFIADDGTIYEP